MTEVKEQLSFSINAKSLIETLKIVGGIIENTQVIPILSHVKLEINNGFLTAITSDSEIEMTATTELQSDNTKSFTTAVSCKKLSDICKSLSSDSNVHISLEDGWLCINCQQSKFMLATLPATKFPRLSINEDSFTWKINSVKLHELLQNTAFAMAEKDVRFFLNGAHISISNNHIHIAATDGHRLASAEYEGIDSSNTSQCILPRKATITLSKLLMGLEDEIIIQQSQSHIKVSGQNFCMTSNLIEGSKIDCQQLIPNNQDALKVDINHNDLKQALYRAAILSHEKFRGAKITLADNCMTIQANNAEQEKTEERIPIIYDKEPIEMAFNIKYLQDLLNALSEEVLTWSFLPENGTVSVAESLPETKFIYVVMSMTI